MMYSKKVSFRNAQGNILHGRLERPIEEPSAYALFAHCFTCGKDSIAASSIARALAESGVATMRFDFTGLGNSDGDFANTNFTTNIDDLKSAVDFLTNTYAPPRLLIGHSLGGAAILALASQYDKPCAVATLGAPYSPSHVEHLFDKDKDKIQREGVAEVMLGGRGVRIGRGFLQDLEKPKTYLSRLRKPLLVLHAPQDQIVGIENAQKIFTHARHPKSFVSLDNADHLLLKREDARYAAHVIKAWAERYVPSAVSSRTALDAQVVVEESLRAQLEQTILSGRHMLIADEPEDKGGLDRGPTPPDFLLAALGACTSMTLRMYARRKGIALTRAHALLDLLPSSPDTKRKIVRRIVLEGDLTAEERTRLINIAEKCPIHRTLDAGVDIQTLEHSPFPTPSAE